MSLSVVHGFLAGGSPDLGAKIIAIIDSDADHAARIARDLWLELFSFRARATPGFLPAQEALQIAARADRGPIVIADVWCNPGGGVAGACTIMLRAALTPGRPTTALGTIWVAMAVRLCHTAGESACFPLRFGGKMPAVAGDLIDADVTVFTLKRDAVQSFDTSVVPLGDCATVRVAGTDVVLNSNRAEAASPNLFLKLGIDPYIAPSACVEIHKPLLWCLCLGCRRNSLRGPRRPIPQQPAQQRL